MPEIPALTRREFLNNGLAAVSTAATMPVFLHHSAIALAQTGPSSQLSSRPGVPDERILVVVQLSGGNDGLNTVVPFGDDAYYRARQRLAVSAKDIIPIEQDRGIGLHPEMSALKEMLDDGTANIIQGAGYPNPNRSHFASMDIWHTGNTLGANGRGWLGKAIDMMPDQQNAMIAIGREAPLAGHGKRARPVSFENPGLFRWLGSDLHDALEAPYQKINREQWGGIADDDDDQAAFVRRTAMNAQIASDRIRQAVARPTTTSFPSGQLAMQLRMVSNMIRAGLPTRVYYVALGGFDTHAGQLGRHQGLLREFAVAVRGFYQELKANQLDGRVLTLAFSEFGRRVAENASRGTDHGAAGPLFMFGPMIRPGLIGQHPSLTELDRGDLKYKVDFRSVYTAVLDQWLKCSSHMVLGKRFRPASVLNSKVV